MKTIRAILNGKKAGTPELRSEIMRMREQGVDLQVRVTWESQDMTRLVSEAVNQGMKRIVVAGGDGTVNEAVTALNQIEANVRPELAIIPMGTANDFATATKIPIMIREAIELAVNGDAVAVDLSLIHI